MFTDEIMTLINQARGLYFRLVLVVGRAGKGKTRVLQNVHMETGATVVNVNLELSRRMLELTERQRILRMPGLLTDILGAWGSDMVLLDNTEMLFDPSLKQEPLRLLQNLSRDVTLVAAWNGQVVDGCLTYAVPDHAEFRRYAVRGFLMLDLEQSVGGDQ